VDIVDYGCRQGVHGTAVLPLVSVHGHGSSPRSGSGVAGSAQGVQGVGGGLLQGSADALADSRKKMITAVRRYLFEPSMAAVDVYAGGVPKYRAELLKFAAYVARHGEPKWFDKPESR
jgi:hypothetical protein